jgi:hypothetical protein
MNEQMKYYENKPAFEIDSWDLMAALEGGENIGGLDWWKRDNHKTVGDAVSNKFAACGCN